MPGIDFSTDSGQRALERLETEEVIWLTTVNASGAPQVTPVWFLWQDDAIVIYSQSGVAKLTSIASNPEVALHFNCDDHGGDVAVIRGTAELLGTGEPATGNADYLEKYGHEIVKIGYTAEQFAQEYCELIRVTPARLRGW